MTSGATETALIEQGVIHLREHDARSAASCELPMDVGESIWRRYKKELSIEFPSPRTDQRWRITSAGVVGYLPVSQELGISLRPKVELQNLFRMLEWAHGTDFKSFEGVMNAQSLEDFFARIANILAKRVLDRARRGLYRTYVGCQEALPFVRGGLDVRRAVTRPWEVRLNCRFDDHTADVEENQILAWSLYRASRNAACTGEARNNVRHAYRTLRGTISVAPVRATDCVGRRYDRLNDDYAPLHALCRFILESSGPSHELGGHSMMPFVISMPDLFERFVHAWLEKHLPRGFALLAQHRIWRSDTCGAEFRPDLVLLDAESPEPRAVLDTKYKGHESPVAADIQQVVAYAAAKRCKRAYLIYPKALSHPLNDRVGDVIVQSATFKLAGDLDAAGAQLLAELGLCDSVSLAVSGDIFDTALPGAAHSTLK